jgi:DNA-binding NarL/FixJ family response regulator
VWLKESVPQFQPRLLSPRILSMSTVVLLHADREVGHRLGDTLGATPDFDVIGVADSLPGLREFFARGLPDVLIVDLMLRPSHVHSLLADLRRQEAGGSPLVLALTMSPDDPQLLDALRHGAHGYFTHAQSAASLASAIGRLLHGESLMSPSIARQIKLLLGKESGDAEALTHPWPLDAADRSLLHWTADGYLVEEVARGLRLSPQAVAQRMQRIYRRLQFDLLHPAAAPPLGISGAPLVLGQAADGAVSMKL